MSSDTNKAIVRRSIEQPLVHGDLATLDEVYAPDYVAHDPSNPDVTDLPGTKAFVGELRASYSDIAVSIDDQIAEGDRVATRGTFRGVDTGSGRGGEPTGRAVAIGGITISRLRDGQIVEEWVQWDALGLEQQLGSPRLE
jgi:predicted ester cyclase